MKPANFPARKLKRSLENVGSNLDASMKYMEDKPDMKSAEVIAKLADARNIRTKKKRS